MSLFHYANRHVLTVGEIYLLSNGKRVREVELVRSTPRGFNFAQQPSGRYIMKKHIYPIESNRSDHIKKYTFMFIPNITIERKKS